MKNTLASFSLIAMTGLMATASFAGVVDFDAEQAGKSPAGWTVTLTGKGEPKWTVEKDDTATSNPNVLKQSGEATYPICIKNNAAIKDGFVEVKFKSVSGKEDQAAGVVWRVKDADNYYVCRANALENNVVLYKTEKGKRSTLDIVGRIGGYGLDTPVAKGQWHVLRVEFAGKKFAVFFDGKKLFEVEDPTFTDAGKVGMWTKADSVMLFDDFNCGSK
jgi:hypothetical protein